jgi:hypothetical protein
MVEFFLQETILKVWTQTDIFKWYLFPNFHIRNSRRHF